MDTFDTSTHYDGPLDLAHAHTKLNIVVRRMRPSCATARAPTTSIAISGLRPRAEGASAPSTSAR